MSTDRTVACTIITANYLARARVLMASLARVHPTWERHVLLVDEIAERFDPLAEDFIITEIAALPLPEKRQFFFRYSLVELATAVKPAFIAWLFAREDVGRVVYLDPDIEVFRPLAEVEEALERGAAICLTPHLTAPIRDDKEPSEETILRAGAFNLGFIALGRHSQLDRFLEWWCSKTRRDCVIDSDAGLFLDQRWLDLAPWLFDDIHVIRHRGYNVAYWNLAERTITERSGELRAGPEPLVFFHYSGFDPLRPEKLSRHQDRFSLAELGEGRAVVERYGEAVRGAGEAHCRNFRYTFGSFESGEPIIDEVRAFYRADPAAQRDGGDDPFDLGAAYFNAPAHGIGGAIPTRLMEWIWRNSATLQRSFPDPRHASRSEFAWWFAERVAAEHHLPDCYVAPVRRALEGTTPMRLRWRAAATRVALRLRPATRGLSPAFRARVRRWLTPPPGARLPGRHRER